MDFRQIITSMGPLGLDGRPSTTPSADVSHSPLSLVNTNLKQTNTVLSLVNTILKTKPN